MTSLRFLHPMEWKTVPRDAAQWIPAPEFLKRFPLVSKNTFYQAIKDGKLPHITLGRKIFLPVDALDQLLEGDAGDESDGKIISIKSA